MTNISCQRCSAIPSDAEVRRGICSNCGAELNIPHVPLDGAVPAQSGAKSIVYVVAGVGGVICLLLGVIIFLLLGNRHSEKAVASAEPPAKTAVESPVKPAAEALPKPEPGTKPVEAPAEHDTEPEKKPAEMIGTRKRAPEVIKVAASDLINATFVGQSSSHRAAPSKLWVVACLRTPISDFDSLQQLRVRTADKMLWRPMFFGVDSGKKLIGALSELPSTEFITVGDKIEKPVTAIVFLVPRIARNGLLRFRNTDDPGQTLAWNPDQFNTVSRTGAYGSNGAPPRGTQTETLEVPPGVRGEAWSYQIKVDGAWEKYEIRTPPPGMTVSKTGLVAWNVPPKFTDPLNIMIDAGNADTKKLVKFTLKAARRTTAGVVEIDRLPKMADDQEYLKLSGKVVRVATAQDGRYAVCGIYESKKISIVDLVEYKEIATLDWPAGDDPSPFAAGGNRVVVYDRKKEMLDVYEVKTGRKETSFRNPFQQPINEMVMGWGADDSVFCSSIRGLRQAEMDLISLPQGARRNTIAKIDEHYAGWNLQFTAGRDLSVITGRRVNDIENFDAMVFAGNSKTYNYSYKDRVSGVLFPLSGHEFAGRERTYSFDLQQFHLFDVSVSGLRPIIGSEFLLGYNNHKLGLYDRNERCMFRSWTSVTEASVSEKVKAPDWAALATIERFHLSMLVGRGFIIPNAPGIIVVPYSESAGGPPVITSICSFRVVPGTDLNVKIGTAGSKKGLKWTIEPPLPDLRVSQDGNLSWRAPADFNRELKCTLKVENEAGADQRVLKFTPTICTLAGKETWPLVNGQLAVGDKKALVEGAPGSKFVVVAAGNEIFSLDAKTLKPLAQGVLPEPAALLRMRGDEAIVVTSRQLIVYPAATLKPKPAIPLPCDTTTDLAVHPGARLSWVAGHDPNAQGGFTARRVVQVNESTGKAQFMDSVYGMYVAATADGRSLVTGVKSEFVNSALVVDIWGDAYRLKRYGTVDLVVRYSLSGAAGKPEQIHDNPGANLRGIVISPDGKYVSPIAGGGFRDGKESQNGYTIPALRMDNLFACDTVYKTDAYPQLIAYHPVLDLVVAGNQEFLRLFDRKTGAVRGQELARPLGFAEISEAFFCGDLSRVCVVGEFNKFGRVAMLIDLPLSPQELQRANAFAGRSVADASAAHDKIAPPEPAKVKPAIKVTPAQLQGLSQPGNTRTLTPKEVAEKFNPAVVLITHTNGSGSGFLISEDGFIATCAHVLPRGNGTVRVQVLNPPKSVTVEATIVGRDDAHDLALLKVTPGFTCRYARFEQKRTALMGEDVTIIGNPGLGATILSNTMTQGIISAPDRKLDGQSFIQTTAAVNPGTSGSPLFNNFGNVIGIVTLKGGIEAAGFAVPFERIKAFMQRCIDGNGQR